MLRDRKLTVHLLAAAVALAATLLAAAPVGAGHLETAAELRLAN
jgi:hypothetical protein